jgi:cysteine-rich repeat protein
MKRYIWLLCSLAALCASSASAQRRTSQGFETLCAGGAITVDTVTGVINLPANAFAGCGLASVVTGEASGMMRIAGRALLLTVPNVSGRNALVGARSSTSPSNLTLTFAPPVNEIALQVLGTSNSTSRRVRVDTYDAAGVAIATETAPGPTGGIVRWSRSAITPVARLVLTYAQGGGSLVDWYVDELSFNAWVCGDGEIENTNGSREVCDDGNRAQCDGCSATCTASAVGCFDGATCVAAGAGTACSLCDPSKPAGPSGDVPMSPRPVGSACDDALKCTQGDACDAAGRCVGTARSCDDALTCTTDACSEAAAGDGCTHAVGAHDCLIGAVCVPELAPNPANACQQCDPVRSASAWSPQANTVRCAAPTCVGAQFTPAALCDGAGSCAPPTPTSCGNSACTTASSCTDRCSDDRECGMTSHCDPTTMKCVDNQGLGVPCTSAAQCGSGLACVDGVCCESACGSRCETCNAPGSAGKCTPITMGDPERECPEGSSCRSGNQCLPESTPPDSDAGISPPPGSVLPIGAACSSNEACGVGVCKDGVCCDSACDGPCQGCNVLGSTPGQCTAYSPGSDPEDECAGMGGVCGGENACTFYETRGNGLCSPLPGQPGNAGYALALVGLVLALASRRRSASSRT